MVPGFMNGQTTIQNWGPFFASHGIVTMTIGANALTDTHIQRRDALLDAIISLKNENQRVGSPLYQKIDTSSVAVGGFSKGGGGAQLVPSIDPSIKAVVALYPWLENPIALDLNHGVPVIIVSGQLDVIAPPSLHADVHYNLTPSTTKKLKYEIAFASHDPISGPYAGAGEVGVRVISWLHTFLLGDTCYCPIIIEDPITSSSYITNVICDDITVDVSHSGGLYSKKVIEVRDLFGRKVNINTHTPLFYFYDDGTVEKKIILE
jgi:predicted esterase